MFEGFTDTNKALQNRVSEVLEFAFKDYLVFSFKV